MYALPQWRSRTALVGAHHLSGPDLVHGVLDPTASTATQPDTNGQRWSPLISYRHRSPVAGTTSEHPPGFEDQRPRIMPAARRWDLNSSGAASTRGRLRGESSRRPDGPRARSSSSTTTTTTPEGVLGHQRPARGREATTWGVSPRATPSHWREGEKSERRTIARGESARLVIDGRRGEKWCAYADAYALLTARASG
ncbi:hypothetical protein C8Q77DRAFT_1270154 [Trametes polyzona]|nr:hypothetical protein C8Q77DRAFT_1270154 [Trametes polyzona]